MPTPTTPRSLDPTSLEPVPTLLRRLREEQSATFVPGRPVRVARAPGRLDVMGGIADYTGSLVCEATLDRAAAVAVQRRDDRVVQVFSFNLLDEHQPFTLQMRLDDLAVASVEALRTGFAESGRRWAGYLIGCLYVLHEQGLIDLRDPAMPGLNLALLSTVPLGAGVSSSAAIEVATMLAFLDELGVPRTDTVAAADGRSVDPLRLASLCQRVENRIVGAPCGIMDQVTSCYGKGGALLRLVCQPHELQPALSLPEGIRAVGINSAVKHSVGGGQYGITRCAAFMGHRMILAKMHEMAEAASMQLVADPMSGYLANIDHADYKRWFRGYLPEEMKGSEFLSRFQFTHDTATQVNPELTYPVQSATDHHVMESLRVRNFVGFIEQAARTPDVGEERKLLLDKAGHLMYASHVSYTRDARLGADECCLLVDLVRAREYEGLFGAKITGGGSGGTVAVLARQTPRADAAIAEIMDLYEKKTGRKPESFLASSPGAWHVGTACV
jgi:L-arabinokinase